MAAQASLRRRATDNLVELDPPAQATAMIEGINVDGPKSRTKTYVEAGTTSYLLSVLKTVLRANK